MDAVRGEKTGSETRENVINPEWEAVSGLLGDRIPVFEVGKDNPYKKWMESEVRKRAEKHEKMR